MATSKSEQVEKPWGYYEDYFRADEAVFKKIVVDPRQSLSYQRHSKREEFWYVVQGRGKMRLNTSYWWVHPGSYFHIKSNEAHQLINDGDEDEDIIVYEMQFGKCSEDDIVRIEDKYGRVEPVEND